jgi:hypothetical protein
MVLAMARPFVAVAFAATAALALFGACGPKPVYPACNSDVVCNQNGHHDYCVAGACAECRTAMDCGTRQRCRAGRCEADPDAPLPPDPVEAGPPPEDPPPPPPPRRKRYYDD